MASPDADVFGECVPPVEAGPVAGAEPVTAGPLELLAPPATGDCANEMLAEAVTAIRNRIDEKVFISLPGEKLTT